jgi:hypothetical protein
MTVQMAQSLYRSRLFLSLVNSGWGPARESLKCTLSITTSIGLEFEQYRVVRTQQQVAVIQLVSCNRSSQHKSAPKERHNVAHGVSRGLRHPPSSLSPLPLVRERGAEGGVRVLEPRGSEGVK